MPRTLERRYRALSYGFRVRTQLADVLDDVDRLLAPFAVSEPGEGWPTYEIRQGRATYRVLLDGQLCQRTETRASVVDYMAWRASTEAIGATSSFIALHAGAVERDGVGVVLPAPPDSGKTTLTAALVRSGLGYLSDEAALIDPRTGLVHPFPRALAVEAPSMEVLGLRSRGEAERSRYQVVASELGVGGRACRVGLVVFPAYRPESEVVVEPVGRAEALVGLYENSFNASGFGVRGLEVLADVVRGAACYRLTMGDLDEAVAAVTGLADGKGTA